MDPIGLDLWMRQHFYQRLGVSLMAFQWLVCLIFVFCSGSSVASLSCWYFPQALQNVVESVITMKQLLQILQGADLETLGEEVQNMVK
jgi:hypothetical protein